MLNIQPLRSLDAAAFLLNIHKAARAKDLHARIMGCMKNTLSEHVTGISKWCKALEILQEPFLAPHIWATCVCSSFPVFCALKIFSKNNHVGTTRISLKPITVAHFPQGKELGRNNQRRLCITLQFTFHPHPQDLALP